MDHEELHDEGLAIFGQLAGAEVHQLHEGRVVILMPVDFWACRLVKGVIHCK